MSAKVAMQVLESGLPERLKLTAVTLALFGDDAGKRIFPSVSRLAHLVGKKARQIRTDLNQLRGLGVLVSTTRMRVDARTGRSVPVGGRNATTHYRMNLTALPTRPAWIPPCRLTAEKGAVDYTLSDPKRVQSEAPKGCSGKHERVQSAAERVQSEAQKGAVDCTRSVRDPLVDPLERSTAASPRFPSASTPDAATDNGGVSPNTFHVIAKLAHTVMDTTGVVDGESPDLVEDVKRACAAHHIDYTTDPSIVRRAVAWAAVQRKLGGRQSPTDWQGRPH